MKKYIFVLIAIAMVIALLIIMEQNKQDTELTVSDKQKIEGEEVVENNQEQNNKIDSIIDFDSRDFMFVDEKGNKDKPIKVWFYKPTKYNEDSRILFVMHGTSRTGEKYRKYWIDYAEKYNALLLVPEFTKKLYPGSEHYNLGNMYNEQGELNDKDKWTFTAIEHLFDYVKSICPNNSEKYFIYGHSAGGQFVHRLVIFNPEARIEKAISTNSGWYTIPNFEEAYPYGVKDTWVDEEQLNKFYESDIELTILIGKADIDENDPDLRKTDEAMKQGKHRFERARYFYDTVKKEMESRSTDSKIRFEAVKGVGHSNAGMAPTAAKLIFED